MMISFRTGLFDTSSPLPDGAFRGEDLARWLAEHLSGWDVGVVPEDWGWAVTATKGEYRYLFGVYDMDTDDVTDQGARWVLQLNNQKDGTPWYAKLFRNIPPVAHPEVTQEVVRILTQTEGISGVSMEPL